MKPLYASAVFVFVMSSFLGLSAALGTTEYANLPVEDGYGVSYPTVETISAPLPTLRDDTIQLAAR